MHILFLELRKSFDTLALYKAVYYYYYYYYLVILLLNFNSLSP